jgi:putative membrane protein
MKMNRTLCFACFALISTLCCCGAFAQMHGAGGQATQQMGPDQESKNEIARGPAADRKFLEKAMESNVAEIQMGRLALEKSTDEQVRHFAIQMTDDHGKMLDDLKQAAGQLNIPVPEAPSKSAMKSLEKMKTLSGAAFDQAYIKEMEKAHKEDDKAFKEEARTTTSPQLKEMVTQDAQMIESHLQQIQQIAQSKVAAKG